MKNPNFAIISALGAFIALLLLMTGAGNAQESGQTELQIPITCITGSTPADASGALSDRYGEVGVFNGFSQGLGSVVSLFLNEETGTWTFVAFTASGLTCMVAEGILGDMQAISLPDEES